MNKKQLLVASSLEHGRDAAFERGLAIARASQSELYLLHAVPADRPFSSGEAERRERTARFEQRAHEAGVPLVAVEQHGDPAEIIELHASSRGVDLIVMGTERPPRRRLLRRASIAERVLRRTTRPTLIVPRNDEAGAPFGNVLVAVDLSPGSETLVQHALRLAGDAPRVSVMHAVTDLEARDAIHNPARWAVPEYRSYLLEHAREQVQAVLKSLSTPVDAGVRVVAGPAADAIAGEATALGADLVVVGRGHRFRPLGRTALRVLRDEDRAMLVVPVRAGIPAAGHDQKYKPAA